MSIEEREIEAIATLAGAAAERIGGPVANALVHALAGVVGAAVLRGAIDEWEAARVPSTTAFEAKFDEPL
jgi:hypothetical protein